MSLIYDTIINMIDYLILFKYFNCFAEKRNIKKNYCVALFAVCVITISIVNQFNNQRINLILCILMIYWYSFSFTYKIPYYIILPILYIGFGLVAELICFYILDSAYGVFSYNVSYYTSSFVCEGIRYLIVYMICSIKKIKLPEISFNIGKFLFIIPVSSIIICCIAINIIKNNDTNIVSGLCFGIIIMTVASNILMYKFFNKLLDMMEENHNNEMLLQEAKLKEEYYLEVEKSNNTVCEIRHNLKNILLGMYGEYGNDKKISEGISKIVQELDESDKKIYTSNIILNTIISSKINYAKTLCIDIEVTVKVPKSVKLDYRDAGVLIGNILDNAIEACERIDESLRWIKIDIVYKGHSLFIRVTNSKDIHFVNIEKTNKLDVKNHGIGIPSIKRVVEKHNGIVEFIDKGKEFEVSASLYGIG